MKKIKVYIYITYLISFIKNLSCPEVEGRSLDECKNLTTYNNRFCCHYLEISNTGEKKNLCVEINSEHFISNSSYYNLKNQVDERCKENNRTCYFECDKSSYIKQCNIFFYLGIIIITLLIFN